MYDAKNEKSGWCLYDPTTLGAPARLSRLAELRVALQEHQLLLHYQPKIDLASGAVTGVEALVRWMHPERGLIPPSDFIPLAEQTGLIHPLTTFVLSEALRQCRAWRDAGRVLTVAVNIAPRSLADPQLASAVIALLEVHGVPPAALELEITESGLMLDPVRSLQTLRDLHAAGIRLALDDFGTGYSSLSRLRDLPIDDLKIDRSFVTAMTADAHGAQIVQSTIALGQSLDMHVVAEGVEDAVVLERLVEYGCDAAQGFHIAAPVSPDELEQFFDSTSG
jgi:EAL domain-containing protein (putative c-di-GMP-specific phosphodiesterase class I)